MEPAGAPRGGAGAADRPGTRGVLRAGPWPGPGPLARAPFKLPASMKLCSECRTDLGLLL